MTTKACMLCAPAREGSRVEAWASTVRSFWRKYPLWDRLFQWAPALFLVTALVFNSVAALSPYAAVPFMGFMLSYGLGEFIPVSKMPYANLNAVSFPNKWTGVVVVSFLLGVMAFAFGALMELVNPTGREDLFKRVVSTCIIAIPIVGLFFLLAAHK